VYARNQRLNASQAIYQPGPGGDGLDRSAHPCTRRARRTPRPVNVAGRGGHGEGLRRTRADAAGAELGTDPVERFGVNVGTIPMAPAPVSIQLAGGKARRRLMPPGWGGGPVVVGGRESRPQGEGVQRVYSVNAEGGDRW
jgi:hypothetical protein